MYDYDQPRDTPDSERVRVSTPPLDLQVSYRFGPPLVYVSGELDHASADQLRKVLDAELTERPKVLLLEFSKLSYMDSGGLGLVFETIGRVEAGGWLGVVGAHDNVRRLMDMTGLSDQSNLRVIQALDGVPAALASLQD
jgi:stage II sporulation protein AA (anti-sigma F factor antagonist)